MLSIPQRYRQTDRQTDRRTTYDSNTALALRASRGKNKTGGRENSAIKCKQNIHAIIIHSNYSMNSH